MCTALIIAICLTALVWSGTDTTAAIAFDLSELGVVGYFRSPVQMVRPRFVLNVDIN